MIEGPQQVNIGHDRTTFDPSDESSAAGDGMQESAPPAPDDTGTRYRVTYASRSVGILDVERLQVSWSMERPAWANPMSALVEGPPW